MATKTEKKKTTKKANKPPVTQVTPPKTGKKTDTAPTTEAEKVEYAFPTKSRCPRCRGTQTEAYSTKGKIQYRKCKAPICQKKFTVRGQKV